MVLEYLGASSVWCFGGRLGCPRTDSLSRVMQRVVGFTSGPRDLHHHASSPALAYDQQRRERGSWGTTRCSMREITVSLLCH